MKAAPQLQFMIRIVMFPVLLISLAKGGMSYVSAGLLAGAITIICGRVCECWLERAKRG